ncbi:MAG: 50S ribosomal protein L19e [Crenarchaeota archaeon]|nr:50S ribosomal protein L19e [Thermoproteota archaeon]
MDLSYQRRLAAELLGVGETRIRFDPEQLDRVASAVTKDDIRRLIKDGVITVEPPHSNSRGRWRIRHEQRRKGRRRGYGRRKGSKWARFDKKEAWMNKIRKMRRFLRWLRDHGVIDRRTYRRLYLMAKGGAFESLASLKRYMKDHGLLPQEYR